MLAIGTLQVNTVPIFGMRIHSVNMATAVDAVLGWCREPLAGPCRYVVTPNVDHAVMYQSSARLREAYNKASLVLADGNPIVLASRLLRRPLPERVAGSDLVPAIFDRCEKVKSGSTHRELRVFYLGARPGVAARAAQVTHQRWKQIEVVGTYSPPLGFEQDDSECRRIVQLIAKAKPDLLLIGLGAPKQELWIEKHASQLEAKVALCVGATIDFLAGEKTRSPVWMQKIGFEWLHRLLSEPKRLAFRYLRDAWVFPKLLWKEYRDERMCYATEITDNPV